ncbi:hypothetical protein [Sphingobium fuliginis]|jgi:hypothetical protein|uniref:hypothetical protein n=1 Tax=Sphingobium fuliginis (strain ATCC 27551) TaxID=336203 RepID=UPI0037CB24F8
MKLGVGIHEYEIVKTRWGLCHAFKQADGSYVHCRRNPATCVVCHNEGIPPAPVDPIDQMIGLLRANWGKRWAESNRHPGELAEDQIWPAAGLHIVAIEDEDRANRTVLVSFGDDPTITAAVSALVHVHNEMIGKAD